MSHGSADRNRRHGHLGPGVRPPAAPRARHHGVRGRGPGGRAHQHRARGRRRRHPLGRHRLHRLQRPQLPQLRAAAGRAGRGDAEVAHELLGQRRQRGLRVQRHPARPVRQAGPRRQPPLPADGRRPAALQPRGTRPDGAGSGRGPVAARVPGRRRLRRVVHRAADRGAGLGGVVGRPRADVVVPGRVPGPLLPQPRHARLHGPAAVAHRVRRLAPLRGGDHAPVRGPHPPRCAGPRARAHR